MPESTCAYAHCETTFVPVLRGGHWQRFCSRRCKDLERRTRNYRRANPRPDACVVCGAQLSRRRRSGQPLRTCGWDCHRIHIARTRSYDLFDLRAIQVTEKVGHATVASYRKTLRLDPCGICSQPGGNIDHIQPRSLGGPNHVDNYAGICMVCNSRKSNLPLLTALISHQLEAELQPLVSEFLQWRPGKTQGGVDHARLLRAA